MPAALSPELQTRLDGERDRWLRRRFRLYYTVLMWSALAGTLVLAQALARGPVGSARLTILGGLFFTILCAAVAAYPLAYIARREQPPARSLLRVSYVVTSTLAALLIFPSAALGEVITEILRARGHPFASVGPMLPWAICFLFIHVLASLALPWRPAQAFRAYAFFSGAVTPFLLLAANDSPKFKVIGLTLIWAIGVPGMLICALRQSRFARNFRLRAFDEHVAESRQELEQARAIHDALFPEPITDGPARVAFAYEPMRSIGGDFLYARRHDSGVSIVLVDVTGHGIPAALTVNRLHGELDRLFGERPDASPGLVLHHLNSYLHFALARHSVYATAFCASLSSVSGSSPRANLRWASGGHPPAFVRGASGELRRLDSTALVLGAAPPDDFEHGEQTDTLAPGERLIAYTDGATEARNAAGDMLRIDGFASLLRAHSAAGGSTPDSALAALRRFRSGPPTDDTLIVELAYSPGA